MGCMQPVHSLQDRKTRATAENESGTWQNANLTIDKHSHQANPLSGRDQY
jgi:hypothetical protein